MSNTVRYQLRRVPPVITPAAQALNIIPLDCDVLKFGRNPDHVQVVLHSTVYSNMISREHAEVRKQRNPDGTIAFYLFDKSLNGTYINEHRVKTSVLLHPGDVIKFGHVNGAAIAPGSHAPQPQAEFTFVFEKQGRGSSCSDLSSMSNKQPSGYPHNFQQNHSSQPFTNQAPYASPAAAGQRLVAAYQQQAGYGPGLSNQALNAYHRAALLSHPAYAAALYGYSASRPHQPNQPQSPWPNVPPVTCSSTAYSSSCALDTSTSNTSNPASARWGFASTPAGMFPVHQVAAFQQQVQMACNPALVTCSSPTSSSPSFSSTSIPSDTKCDVTTLNSPPLVRAADSSALKVGSPLCHSPPLSVGTNQPHTVVSVDKGEPVSPDLKIVKSNCDMEMDIKRMECDSSVPSPPKAKSDEEGLSRSLRALAASAAVNSRLLYNTSPVDLIPSDKDEKEDKSVGLKPDIEPEEKPRIEKSNRGRRKKGRHVGTRIGMATTEIAPLPATSAHLTIEPVKNRRKSNEVSRLLNDLTEGIFMNIVAGKKPIPKAKKRKKEKSESERGWSSADEASPSSPVPSPSPHSPATIEKEKRSPLKKRKEFRSPPPSAEEPGPSWGSKYKEDSFSDTSLSSPPTPKRTKKKGAARHKLKVRLSQSVSKRKAAAPRNLPPKKAHRLGFIPPPIGLEGSSQRKKVGTGKKRGRPRKDPAKPDALTPEKVDLWHWHDAGEKCHADDKCAMPQQDNIDWVECDDCNEWYHVLCVQDMVFPDEDDFHCGCSKTDDDKD